MVFSVNNAKAICSPYGLKSVFEPPCHSTYQKWFQMDYRYTCERNHQVLREKHKGTFL